MAPPPHQTRREGRGEDERSLPSGEMTLDAASDTIRPLLTRREPAAAPPTEAPQLTARPALLRDQVRDSNGSCNASANGWCTRSTPAAVPLLGA